MLLECKQEVVSILDAIQTSLAEHRVKGEALIAEAEERRANRRRANPGLDDSDDEGAMSADEDSGSTEEARVPKTPAGDEYRAKLRSFQARLRETHIVKHKVYFLIGNVNHALGRAEDEKAGYDQAEEIRANVLKGATSTFFVDRHLITSMQLRNSEQQLQCSPSRIRFNLGLLN